VASHFIKSELPSPALLLDLPALERNVAAMASWTSANGVAVRPHAKVHKCCEIARRQLRAGAVGLTVATVYEAEAMLAAGPPEVLVANEVVGSDHLRRLAGVARRTALLVAVDDEENARQLSACAEAGGVEIGLLLDVDVGMGRCGVRSVQEALALAEVIRSLPGVQLRGAMGYEGQVVLEAAPEMRAARARTAMDLLASVVSAVKGAGHDVGIVSAGGTNTHDMTGLHAVVTELQPGTYAVMDTGYARLSPRFVPVLSVHARVLSHQGGTVVLDCGTKAVAVDVTPPTVPPSIGRVREVHEEHMLLDAAEGSSLRPGDAVEVAVGYTGGTVNLHDGYYVVDGDEVVDIWRILARGSGRIPECSPDGTTFT
jgi:D-serine deaminase-like pyridoxal phosphate-dependent protein